MRDKTGEGLVEKGVLRSFVTQEKPLAVSIPCLSLLPTPPLSRRRRRPPPPIPNFRNQNGSNLHLSKRKPQRASFAMLPRRKRGRAANSLVRILPTPSSSSFSSSFQTQGFPGVNSPSPNHGKVGKTRWGDKSRDKGWSVVKLGGGGVGEGRGGGGGRRSVPLPPRFRFLFLFSIAFLAVRVFERRGGKTPRNRRKEKELKKKT